MRKFIKSIFAFGLWLLISFYIVYSLADGSTDAMYLRFTTPRQSSLILGGSRASQGMQPTHLNRVLNRSDLYNYAFQNPTSPYGEIYLNSVKRKLKKSNSRGLFILEVNPWNMVVTDSFIKNEAYLTESGNFLDNTHDVTANPNLEYLIESFDKRVMTIFENKRIRGNNQTYVIEEDGWLHVSIKPDSIHNFSGRWHKIKIYSEKLNESNGFSEYRRQGLIKTINYLKAYGSVYVVRMPVHPEMLSLENKLVPDFDSIMYEVVEECQISYINKMSSNVKYIFVDGHHLDIQSGREFSIDLAETIKNMDQ